MPRIAFISDLHLGGYLTLGPDNLEYRTGIAKIIRYLHSQNPTHFVQLGDIFDSWAFPITEVPLTYDQMFAHPDNTDIIAALKEIQADPAVTQLYCWGNHDYDLPADMFRTWFPATQVDNSFNLGFVWGEHGHRWDLFNAPDPLNLDPAGGYRPMGYYITRIHTQAPSRSPSLTFSEPSSSTSYIRSKVREARDSIQNNSRGWLTSSDWTVSTIVLDVVVRGAGASYSDVIRMPEGSPDITIQQVADAYRDLFKSWESKNGLLSSLNAVLAADEYLDPSAQEVRNEQGERLVVFGHSHVAKWNPMTVKIGGQGVTGAYVNDGALCKWPQSAVIVDFLPDTYKINRLFWDITGNMSTETQEILNTW